MPWRHMESGLKRQTWQTRFLTSLGLVVPSPAFAFGATGALPGWHPDDTDTSQPEAFDTAKWLEHLRFALRRLAAIAGILVLVWLGIWHLWLPHQINRVWLPTLSQQTDCHFQAKGVSVNPWLGRVHLNGLQANNQAGQPVFASKTSVITLRLQDAIASDDLRFKQVILQSPTFFVANLADNQASSESTQQGPSSTNPQPTDGPSIAIDRVEIQDGKIEAAASPNNTSEIPVVNLDVVNLNLQLDGLTTSPRNPGFITTTVRGDAKVLDGTVAFEGKLSPNPSLLFEGDLRVQGLKPSPLLQPLIDKLLPPSDPASDGEASNPTLQTWLQAALAAGPFTIDAEQHIQVGAMVVGSKLPPAISGDGKLSLTTQHALVVQEPMPITVECNQATFAGRWSWQPHKTTSRTTPRTKPSNTESISPLDVDALLNQLSRTSEASFDGSQITVAGQATAQGLAWALPNTLGFQGVLESAQVNGIQWQQTIGEPFALPNIESVTANKPDVLAFLPAPPKPAAQTANGTAQSNRKKSDKNTTDQAQPTQTQTLASNTTESNKQPANSEITNETTTDTTALVNQAINHFAKTRFQIKNGRAQVLDPSHPKAKPLLVDQLQVTLGPGQANGKAAHQLTATARILGQGELKANIQLPVKDNPTLALDNWQTLTGQVNVDLKQLPLPPLSNYSEQLIGFQIAKGAMNLELPLSLTKGKLKGPANFHFIQLALGEKSNHPDAPNGDAIAAGLSLLQRPNGDMDASVDLTGDLSNPQFSARRLVTRAVGILVQRMLTSPLDVLATMFGGEPGVDYTTVLFVPGTLRPFDQETGKLDVLAQTLKQRPDITLTLVGAYEPRLDLSALQREANRQSIFGNNDRLGGGVLDRNLDPSAQSGMGLPGQGGFNVAVMELKLRRLARDRAQWVADELIEQRGVPKEQVRIGYTSGGEGSLYQQALVKFVLPEGIRPAPGSAPAPGRGNPSDTKP